MTWVYGVRGPAIFATTCLKIISYVDNDSLMQCRPDVGSLQRSQLCSRWRWHRGNAISFLFDKFGPFSKCQDSCQSRGKVPEMPAQSLDGQPRDVYIDDDEISAALGVRATPSRNAWTERRPPRLTPGSCRGRGSSPARAKTRGNQINRNGPLSPGRIGGDRSEE